MGLIGRALEEAGISTLSMTSARDITASAGLPRGAFLDYPLGHTSGRPQEVELNRSIMLDTLLAFETIEAPGTIVDLPYHWDESDDWKDAAMRPLIPEPGADPIDDRVERLPDPQYQHASDADAAQATHAGLECAVCAGVDF
ncbi:MAG: hypothetical protein ACR2OD_04160 [Gaiellaceae bacterium]